MLIFILGKKRKKRYDNKSLKLPSPNVLLVILIREEVFGSGGIDGWRTSCVGYE